MAILRNGVTTLDTNRTRTVGDPNPQYDSLADVYLRNRACLSGQRYVKDLDNIVGLGNILIPFSASMTQNQYDFYRNEAEWPGITEQYARTIIGGLLRKAPQLDISEDVEGLTDELREDITNWLRNNFTRENSSLISFLDAALWEEMNTSRAWVCVNYPVTDPDSFDPEELAPYPILLAGESIINWATGINPRSNKNEITRLVIRMFRERQSTINPVHVDYVDTTWVHQLDDSGYYEIIVYERDTSATQSTPVISGRIQQLYPQYEGATWIEVERETNILRDGERLDYIPIFPLNGEIEPMEPMLTNLINREIGLYNTISRRNHLLYSSASFTPVIATDSLTDTDKDEIVNQGLGSWLFLPDGATADVLSAPTEALEHLETAISSRLDEMARLGIRILSPEESGSAQSGIALEIRNAAQTSQLATMNQKVSEQMTAIIATMISWRYGLEINEDDITFQLSSDFNPAPIGADWVRLVADWYQQGLISRSVFVEIARQNDILPSDYDDEEAQDEILNDDNVITQRERFDEESQANTPPTPPS